MKREDAKMWLDFAKKDLKVSQIASLYGELDMATYHCQQAAEKSLKAIIVFYNIQLPPRQFRTHNIGTLLEILSNHEIQLPKDVLESAHLTDYAFTTRYPDDYVPVSKEEYKEAYKITEKVYEYI
ncbi:MAG: HEPN domain-containing protein [Chlorobi bacterium]|nr:HEPN domain-containing protein [Chlorobiota bacterium]